MIWDEITYVDLFTMTWVQFKGEHTIGVGLLNGTRTSSSNPQLSWMAHFFQIVTQSIVIKTLLLISTAKVVMDILLNVSQLNMRAPGMLQSVAATIAHMTCIAVAKA